MALRLYQLFCEKQNELNLATTSTAIASDHNDHGGTDTVGSNSPSSLNQGIFKRAQKLKMAQLARLKQALLKLHPEATALDHQAMLKLLKDPQQRELVNQMLAQELAMARQPANELKQPELKPQALKMGRARR